MDGEGPWWRRNPALLSREINAMRTLLCAGWLRDLKLGRSQDGLLRCGTILFIKNFRFELVYPTEFPATCPIPYPQKRGERWSTHQWRDGALCTEYGSDTWHPGFTGADVLRSLYTLLVGEHTPRKGFRPPLRVESRHTEERWPPSFAACGVILWPASAAAAEGDGGEIMLSFLPDSRNFRFLVRSLRHSSTGAFTTAQFPSGLALPQVEIAGRWYRVTARLTPRQLLSIEGVDDLGRVVNRNSSPAPDIANELRHAAQTAGDLPVPVILVDADGKGVAGFLYRPVSSSGEKDTLLPMTVLPYDPERISSRRASQQPALKSAQVAIVGLGSLGGKIAVSLARIGITDFVLVDPDVLLWENLSRHEGGIPDVGSLKSDLIARRIRSFAPAASIKEFDVAVGGIVSPQRHQELSQALIGCSIIVDASAEPGVARALAGLCQPSRIPSVHVEIFARGLGALLMRVLPTITGCYHCQHAAVVSYFEEQPPAPEQQAIGYDGTRGEPGSFVTADDDACTITAGVATRLVKDSILQKGGLSSSVPGHIYLLGLESEWIFCEPFAVTRIESSAPNRACIGCCGPDATSADLGMSAEEIAAVARNVEELIESGNNLVVTDRSR